MKIECGAMPMANFAPIFSGSLCLFVVFGHISAEQELCWGVCQVRAGGVGHGQRRLGRRGRTRVQAEAGGAQEGAEEGGRKRERWVGKWTHITGA